MYLEDGFIRRERENRRRQQYNWEMLVVIILALCGSVMVALFNVARAHQWFTVTKLAALSAMVCIFLIIVWMLKMFVDYALRTWIDTQ